MNFRLISSGDLSDIQASIAGGRGDEWWVQRNSKCCGSQDTASQSSATSLCSTSKASSHSGDLAHPILSLLMTLFTLLLPLKWFLWLLSSKDRRRVLNIEVQAKSTDYYNVARQALLARSTGASKWRCRALNGAWTCKIRSEWNFKIRYSWLWPAYEDCSLSDTSTERLPTCLDIILTMRLCKFCSFSATKQSL